jgi:hypothetical protein
MTDNKKPKSNNQDSDSSSRSPNNRKEALVELKQRLMGMSVFAESFPLWQALLDLIGIIEDE